MKKGINMERIKKWAKENKWEVGKTILLLITDFLIAGLLGGLLAWGPLDANYTILVPVLAVSFSFIAVSLRLWQKYMRINGYQAGIKWLRRVNLGKYLVFLGIVILAMVQLYNMGSIPWFRGDYESNFNKLWVAMDKHYPYFQLKEVDWDEVHQKYAPQVSNVENDDQYHHIINNMLSELNDGHTNLVKPGRNNNYIWFGAVVKIDGKAVVTNVLSGINIPGLSRGSVILTKNGMDIDEYIKQLDPTLVSGSTDRHKESLEYLRVLAIPVNQDVEISYLSPTGERHTATLNREMWTYERKPGPIITARKLSSGIGVINLPKFDSIPGHDLVAEFDAALDKVFDAPAIIIDLRSNSGGSTLIADPIAGRFISKSHIYGKEYRKHRLPFSGWSRVMRYRVKPRGKIYAGPVVILTSVRNMSTAESFIVSLVDTGRAITIGNATAGASGNPTPFFLPGGSARFSTGDWCRTNGERIEGNGINPDIQMDLNIKDLQKGIDRHLLTAEDYLLKLDGEED